MSIYLTGDTRAIIQGGTGRIGQVQLRWMLGCGTNIVAAVTPGRGGESVEGIPVYDSVAGTVKEHGANAAVLFVPAALLKEAVIESIEAGIKLIVAVPEHVPVHDSMELRRLAKERGVTMLGPNTPGIISPGIGKLGIMPANLFRPGSVGVISRSGTLAYEVAGHINEAGMGESTLVGIGGDPVIGVDISDILNEFERDPGTDSVVMIGEIGGSAEEGAAATIAGMKKPVVVYIAGRSAPAGRTMGHAGAIIRGKEGTAEAKFRTLEGAGAKIALSIKDVPGLLLEARSSGQGGANNGTR